MGPLASPGRERPSRESPGPSTEAELLREASLAVKRGTEFLLSQQREDGRWCAELESNATITAEFVLLNQILGRDLGNRKARIVRYLLGQQNLDGSWGIARPWPGDVSSTAEAYLALRILGLGRDDPRLRRAEAFVLGNGGLEKIRIFTRIWFAMFGLMPWSAIPAIPPEVILLPPSSPVNIYSLSSWARGTMVPLFVIFHHRPVFALPNGRSPGNGWLDHLWLDPADKEIPYSPPLLTMLRDDGPCWKSFFRLVDSCLWAYERAHLAPLRRRALRKCVSWILERQESSGDWAGIFPPMVNNLVALFLSGYGPDSEPMRKGLSAIEAFSWEDVGGYRIQACVSPVWDTVLATIGLIDSGMPRDAAPLRNAMSWLLGKQILSPVGDWKTYRPSLAPGGWSFEYFNSWYPDVDDTAAAILALLKQDPRSASSEPVRKAVEWTLGMQNRDGGWAAFDVENDKLFLNHIPFADIDALCDPSTADVTGRVVEALALLRRTGHAPPELSRRAGKACRKAVEHLRKQQEEAGPWFGRWGVNYVYGTSNVLCGLAQVPVPAADPMVARALRWLKRVQNSDGGWGESIASYVDARWMGKGKSTPSQTAWALMGLLAYLPPDDASIRHGVHWLLSRQLPARPEEAREGGSPVPAPRGWTWSEDSFTATGFPKHFYLRYHLYRHYFPMMALGRFLQAWNS